MAMRLAELVALARRNSLYILGAAAVATLLAVYLAVIWAPSAANFTAPNAQRIFYFHVPAAWVSYLAFGLLALASVAYLRTENPVYDVWARASAESTLVFSTITLLSGTLWMRAEWIDSNQEIIDRFLWDTRLSVTLVLWFILVGYLVLRGTAPAGEAARLCGVMGIIGFITVPLSFLSSRFLRSNHPNPIASSEGSITGEMVLVMLVGLLAFTLIFCYIMLYRTRMLWSEALIVDARQRILGD